MSLVGWPKVLSFALSSSVPVVDPKEESLWSPAAMTIAHWEICTKFVSFYYSILEIRMFPKTSFFLRPLVGVNE